MQLTIGAARTRSTINITQTTTGKGVLGRGGRDGTFRRIGTFTLAVSFGVAIETDWDEIFDEETCIGKSFEIFFCGGGNLTLGSTKR